MPSCSVKWCSNHTSTCSLKSKNGVSFHRFPKDEATCQKWVEAVRHERRDPWWTSSNASRICSLHFKETDISSTSCRVNILAKTAVPVCTMIWHDENENNITTKTSNERTNTDKPILRTYARKKNNMNVLKESKVNMSNNWNKEGITMSKINSVAVSTMTPCLAQDNIPQATKLLKTSEVSETLSLEEGQELNIVADTSLKTSANANVSEVHKKTVLTELNKKENIKEMSCKSNILVKLNDSTNLILDEDLSNDGTKFKESNNLSKEASTRTCENSKKITVKELKSNENKEPNQVTNISNADMFVESITNGNVELNANISKSYVGNMLKTYLPKRKYKIRKKNIKEKKLIKKNKSLWSITMDKAFNIIKCEEINNTNANKHLNNYFNNKLKTDVCHRNNTIADPQEKKQLCALKNAKKYTIKGRRNLFNRSKIGEQKKSTVDVEPNIDANKESNITYIDEFIKNQSRIDKIKETDTTVYDKIISELFETSTNVGNLSNIPSNGNKASNENMCIESNTILCTDNNKDSALDKGTNNMHVNLDTNIYKELNTLMDFELHSVENTGVNGKTNTDINTDKMAINVSFTQFNENTVSESNQQLSIINENMYYNGNNMNDAIVLSNIELQNLETSVVKNIVPETKKVEFTELKKYLSMSPKHFPSELCRKVLTDIRYDNINSTSLTKENLQVSDRDHNAEYNKNIDIEVYDMVTSIPNNIDTDATKESKSKVTSPKQLNSTKEFITNISSESNNSENVDFISNFNVDSNTTREPGFNNNNISDIHVECTKNLEKDLPDLDTVINLELCSEVDIELSDKMSTEFNKDKMDINADLTQYNDSVVTESDQPLSIINENMTMEHGDHLIPESDYYLPTKINENMTTQVNKNMFYNENITINAIMLPNNELQILDTSVVNNIHVQGHNTKLDKNTNPDVNDMVTSLENNMYNDATKGTQSILLEELINIAPDLNTSESMHFINYLKTDPNTTVQPLNKIMISDINECKKIVGKDMPELNAVIELNRDQILKSKEVVKAKFQYLNTEMYTDKDLLLQKSKKDFVNVLPMSDDQRSVVNEHMDVVDSILNRDIAAEFDLSLLLSDTPIPDEEIQNVDNNSNNNSLDGIGGSPNWLPTGEIPKIIDEILDQGSPFFENLDLFDKVNKFNMDKEANKKDNEIKKPIKDKYSASNTEHFEEQIINNYCETGKPCTKNSIALIEKQLIVEITDYNETNLVQSNNICNENKVSQSEKVTAEKCYDLCGKETSKQIVQCLQPNNEQCDFFNLDQIVDRRCEHSNKEIQDGNNTINKCQKQNNVNSKAKQIEDSSINQYFEQSAKSHREQDRLDTDNSNGEVFNDVDIFELSKKQSNVQTYQLSVGKLATMEESIPKSNFLSQGTLESSVQEMNKELSENFNVKGKDEDNNVSNEAHTAGADSDRELNIGQLKKVIFDQCYDPECLNDCQNQKHNSNTESHKKDDPRFKKQTDNTSSQPDIQKRKRRYDLLHKCYQSNTGNLKKQPNDESFDPNMKHMKKSGFLEGHKLSHNEKYKTNYKKIAIDNIPGQYLELRWKESDGKSKTLKQEGCKRKHKELDLDHRKMLCSESTNNFSHQIMAECPECGYTTDDNDLMNYKSDVDLRITKPLSLINKDMLISLRDVEIENNNQNNENNNRVALESVYALELAYVTAIQALEKKLKQKMAISEHRLRRVNNLSKINNQLTKANVTLMDSSHKNKI